MTGPALPADAEWLPAAERWAGRELTVRDREELPGGYVADAVHRVDLDAAGEPRAVVVKRAKPGEVVALRALAETPGVDRPLLLASGADWIVTPFYPGEPPAADEPVADDVFVLLARVHEHWRERALPGVPVVDAAFWASLCDFTLVAVEGGLARTGDDRFAATARKLRQWRADGRIVEALDLLPATLVHGDPHRGNLLAGPAGTTLIDWGNARMAPASLDLAVLAGQGASTPTVYPALGRAGRAGIERAWAIAHVHVQYMGFAADHLGPARVAEMARNADVALGDLGREFDRGWW